MLLVSPLSTRQRDDLKGNTSKVMCFAAQSVGMSGPSMFPSWSYPRISCQTSPFICRHLQAACMLLNFARVIQTCLTLICTSLFHLQLFIQTFMRLICKCLSKLHTVRLTSPGLSNLHAFNFQAQFCNVFKLMYTCKFFPPLPCPSFSTMTTGLSLLDTEHC